MNLEGTSSGHKERLTPASGRDVGEMPYMGSRAPARGSPPLVGVTRNGWPYQMVIDWPIRERWWIIEALEACAYDFNRLDASQWTLTSPASTTPGTYTPRRIYLTPGASGQTEFVGVTISSGNFILSIKPGLADAEPPYGGERFFKETILHGIGLLVGPAVAYNDSWKKVICGPALGYGDLGSPAQAEFTWTTLADRDFRYAEAFKMMYGAPWARAFGNRSGVEPDYQTLHEESSIYWPFKGLAFLGLGDNFPFGYTAQRYADPAIPAYWGVFVFYYGSVPQVEFMRHSHVAIDGVEPVAPMNPRIRKRIWYSTGGADVDIFPETNYNGVPDHLFDAEFDVDLVGDLNGVGAAPTDLKVSIGANFNFADWRFIPRIAWPNNPAWNFDSYNPANPGAYGNLSDPHYNIFDYPVYWETARWTAPSMGSIVDPPKTSVPRLAGFSHGYR